MVAQAKSLDEVKTALGEPTEPPKRNAQGNLSPPTTTEIIFAPVDAKGMTRSHRAVLNNEPGHARVPHGHPQGLLKLPPRQKW